MLVGGTGLYIKALTDGFSDLPSKNKNLRKSLEEKSIEELSEELKSLDMETYDEIDLNNKVRLVRALEVCILTGEKFSKLKTENIKNNNYRFLKIFLTRNREELYERINKRVEKMFSKGLSEEVRKIYEKYSENRYKITAIGYKELFDYFDGKVSLKEAEEKIKIESRRYAKRQLTWFRKEKDYIIYNFSEMSEKKVISNILKEWENF